MTILDFSNRYCSILAPETTNYVHISNVIQTFNGSPFIEMHVNVLAKPGGIIIADCFRITKCFKNWIRLENLLFNPTVLSTDCCQELEDKLCGFCLSRTRFSTGKMRIPFRSSKNVNKYLMITDWFLLSRLIFVYALSAIAKMCGGNSPIRFLLYIRISSAV